MLQALKLVLPTCPVPLKATPHCGDFKYDAAHITEYADLL